MAHGKISHDEMSYGENYMKALSKLPPFNYELV